MFPQIMWTRHFFYSLGAMDQEQRAIMLNWFSDMNQKQQIYINAIERANDELKQTAKKIFKEKGFKQEKTDLFLKKVNFMENRDYFFYKRKVMLDNGMEGKCQEREEAEPLRRSEKFDNRRKRDGSVNFFDNIGSSCRLDDMPKGPRSSGGKNEVRGSYRRPANQYHYRDYQPRDREFHYHQQYPVRDR